MVVSSGGRDVISVWVLNVTVHSPLGKRYVGLLLVGRRCRQKGTSHTLAEPSRSLTSIRYREVRPQLAIHGILSIPTSMDRRSAVVSPPRRWCTFQMPCSTGNLCNFRWQDIDWVPKHSRRSGSQEEMVAAGRGVGCRRSRRRRFPAREDSGIRGPRGRSELRFATSSSYLSFEPLSTERSSKSGRSHCYRGCRSRSRSPRTAPVQQTFRCQLARPTTR